MKISDVLRNKGTEVVTIRPDDTVARLLEVLDEHRIGAVVVSADGSSVDGIVSERDVVRHVGRSGAAVLDGAVSVIMTREVHCCEQGDSVEELAQMMTDRRIRHVPVVADGALTAIVSIGDVVKHRINALMSERDHLKDYLSQ
ncbi:MAG: CBS domain-containing protein [Dermatophilaceae bacterium]|mgnify:FL=1|jgi:CBS domain-containing protein